MINAILWSIAGYLLLGCVFGLSFLLRGLQRVDPAAAHSTWGFRILILPGCVALWPWILRRWLRAGAAA